jgi:hypothetical protein
MFVARARGTCRWRARAPKNQRPTHSLVAWQPRGGPAVAPRHGASHTPATKGGTDHAICLPDRLSSLISSPPACAARATVQDWTLLRLSSAPTSWKLTAKNLTHPAGDRRRRPGGRAGGRRRRRWQRVKTSGSSSSFKAGFPRHECCPGCRLPQLLLRILPNLARPVLNARACRSRSTRLSRPRARGGGIFLPCVPLHLHLRLETKRGCWSRGFGL